MVDCEKSKKSDLSRVQGAARLSVAPMMDWTDRHCRYLHRLMSKNTLLYTEMVTAPALVRGGAVQLLDFAPEEHPVAVQLGGSDAPELAAATKICVDRGYDEVNLNVGCPSDRVQSGMFGAILMTKPDLVADCVSQMIAAAGDTEVTVKCRIGVDDQEPSEVLPAFIEKIRDAGVKRVQIHARKAWLKGLSPKENRDIPPLDYDLVLAMKRAYPDLHISINGGITTLDQAVEFLDAGLDGVMIGRAAYHTPSDVLLDADARIYGGGETQRPEDIVEMMMPYIADHMANGGRMHQVTRHMLGLFAGRPGARAWRRILSEGTGKPDAGLPLLREALQPVTTG